MYSGSPVKTEPSESSRGIRQVWISVQDICKIIFRALGLNIAISSIQSLQRKKNGPSVEQIKIAVRRNRTTALLRALIHVVPVGVALWEIALNWNTYYVGSTIYNQIYYQIGAKAHEITLQASLAAIVFSFIRYEMVSGKGLPFGTLFSGLQLSQVSYLWSMEFWGSIRSTHLPIWRKSVLLSIIIVSFVLAAACGPSSAVLLIPRLNYWPAGTTDIWVNATFEDIWPSQ